MDVTDGETRVFVELAFERMLIKARLLGDDVAVVPDIDGANSVYALVVHCVGLSEFWFDHVVLGAETERDRAGEFVAAGTIADLERLVGEFLHRLPELQAAVHLADEPARPADEFVPDWPWTVGAIVLHVIEELFQHAGHIDVTADLVLRG